MYEEIIALAEKHDRHIGALGARWGLQSEASFRNAFRDPYERRHDRKADRLIVISPMIDKWARKLAKEFGIEIYSDSSGVEEI